MAAQQRSSKGTACLGVCPGSFAPADLTSLCVVSNDALTRLRHQDKAFLAFFATVGPLCLSDLSQRAISRAEGRVQDTSMSVHHSRHLLIHAN